jgi:hypothetical protein
MAVFRTTSRILRPSGIGVRRFRMKASGLGPSGIGAELPPAALFPGSVASPAGYSGAAAISATMRLGAYSSDGADSHMCAPGDSAVLGTSFAW